MLGLFIYLIMILMPVLIPLGVTVTHAVGEFRTRTGSTAKMAKKSVPATTRRPTPAVAPA
ncbi:hypothetical protein A5791_04170 [Mycobacterium sp. 852002-51163_SCH5372311]|uniref:hypothetical protein n=1 Tax=Mycobacterium sp. 852002-51163_SCH5372311 TaxID=1834097 RepID=UPI0007FF4F43|nr:hypothetical protein [Mycobacterium sp. 852002-51163_SCH5372311]OBF82638.1 hypothetical protein A5791_04170 [Mycobacterium sp. 852002-51163_SCH5372311]